MSNPIEPTSLHPFLRPVDEPGSPTDILLMGARMVAGRASGVEIPIEGKGISRTHFAIHLTGEGAFVENLSQVNTTRVDGRQVTRERLHHGVMITAGARRFIFHSPRPQDLLGEGETVLMAAPAAGAEAAEAPDPLQTDAGGVDLSGPVTERLGSGVTGDSRESTVGESADPEGARADGTPATSTPEPAPGEGETAPPDSDREHAGGTPESTDDGSMDANREPSEEERVASGEGQETLFRPAGAPGEAGGESAASDGAPVLVEEAGGARHPLNKERLVIGRSPEAEIRLDNPYVSRAHAAVQRGPDGRFLLRRLGPASPLSVNGQKVDSRLLADGDRIALDKVVLRYQAGDPIPTGGEAATVFRVAGGEDKDPGGGETILATQAGAAEEPGPRLLWHQKLQPDQLLLLTRSRTTLGRLPDNDLRLDHPTVSKRHLILTQKSRGIGVEPASPTARVQVNGKSVEAGVIYNGDKLRLGDCRLTFLSDRPEDMAPSPEEVAAQATEKPRGGRLHLTVTILLLLLAAGYGGYQWFVAPLQSALVVEEAEYLVEADDYDGVTALLTPVLGELTDPDLDQRAATALARAATLRVDALLADDKPDRARSFLETHLRAHGAHAQADPLWIRLDQIRFSLGQTLEEAGQIPPALGAYLSIRPDSPLFGQAQEAVSRLWLAQQNQQTVARDDEGRDSIEDLLARAEENFSRKRYLVPSGDNAVTYYRRVLVADPGNAIALNRIEEIKDFYRRNGESHFQAGKLDQALMMFRRYLVIDPGSEEIRAQVARIQRDGSRSRAASAGADRSDGGGGEPGVGAGASPGEGVARQQRVRELLQESGVESNWVMEYLFSEEPTADGEEAAPWPE